MAQGGSTMGQEPTWAELLVIFVLTGAVPVVVGGALLLSLIGLTVWVRHALLTRKPLTRER